MLVAGAASHAHCNTFRGPCLLAATEHVTKQRGFTLRWVYNVEVDMVGIIFQALPREAAEGGAAAVVPQRHVLPRRPDCRDSHSSTYWLDVSTLRWSRGVVEAY